MEVYYHPDALYDEPYEKAYALKNERISNVDQLLRAYSLFEKDVEYVLQESKIVIVDTFTGRLQLVSVRFVIRRMEVITRVLFGASLRIFVYHVTSQPRLKWKNENMNKYSKKSRSFDRTDRGKYSITHERIDRSP